MDPLRKRVQHKDSLAWRSPPSPCGPSSPQSPPPLVIRGKSLSLNRVNPPFAPIKETPARELSKRGRKQRLLLSQAGNLTLKRRETSPDFNRLEARLRPKRGKLCYAVSAIFTHCVVPTTASVPIIQCFNYIYVSLNAVFRPRFCLNRNLLIKIDLWAIFLWLGYDNLTLTRL